MKKGQKLKTKTDEQVKTLKNFFEKHVSKEWSAIEVQNLSSETGLSYKEVNKWLWDQ